MERLILAVLLLALPACTTTKYVTAPVEPPPRIERPTLEVSNLKKGDTPDTVIKAHRVTIVQLLEYSKKLEVVLDAYRN
jgi:hypothetical protein